MPNNPFTQLTLFGIVLTMASAGCQRSPSESDGAVEADFDASLIPVRVVSVVQQEVQRTTIQPASIHAYYRAEIQPKATGYVSEVKADLGDFVKKDATLAVIDVPEMRQRRAALEANMFAKRAQARRAKAAEAVAIADVRAAEAMLTEAKARLTAALASLKAADSELQRVDELVRRQSVSRRLLDEAQEKRDSAEANRKATESAIASREAGVQVAMAKQVAAELDVESSQALAAAAQGELDEADALLAYATVKAPFDGVIASRTVDLGDLVRAGDGSMTLFQICQIDTVRVRIPVPETAAAFVRKGDAVSLTLPSFAGEPPIDTTVTRVASDLDPATRTMWVEAELKNPLRKLLPGMFGEATITASAKTVASMLPARSVRFSETGEAFVYVVDDQDAVAVTSVAIGRDLGHTLEVPSLVAGQRVVDAHLRRFVDGQRVTVLPSLP